MLVPKPCFHSPVSILKSIIFRERKVKIKLMNDNPAQPYPAAAKARRRGKINGMTDPVAWTSTVRKSRIFYTSLGYPADFQTSQFNTLLVNAIKCALIRN